MPRDMRDDGSWAALPDARAAGDEPADRSEPGGEDEWPQLSALDLEVCLTTPVPGAGGPARGRSDVSPR